MQEEQLAIHQQSTAVATNNISGKRYIDHWVEAGFESATPMKNSGAGAVKRMGRALKVKMSQFAANVLPIIREIQCAGYTSCNAIAGQLNTRKVATARGGRWTHVQVRKIMDRAPAAES